MIFFDETSNKNWPHCTLKTYILMVLSGYICLLDRMEQSNVSYKFIFIFYGQAKVSMALLCTGQYLSLIVTPSLFKPIFSYSWTLTQIRMERGLRLNMEIDLCSNHFVTYQRPSLVQYFILLLKFPKFIQPTITLLITSRGDQFDLLKTFHDMVCKELF